MERPRVALLIILFVSLISISGQETRRTITFVSIFGDETFQVDESVAKESGLIRRLIRKSHGRDLAPVSTNIFGGALPKIIEYMKLQQGYCGVENRVSDEWEKNFFNQLDNCTLIFMAHGSAQLGIDGLYDLAMAEFSRPQEERSSTGCNSNT